MLKTHNGSDIYECELSPPFTANVHILINKSTLLAATPGCKAIIQVAVMGVKAKSKIEIK